MSFKKESRDLLLFYITTSQPNSASQTAWAIYTTVTTLASHLSFRNLQAQIPSARRSHSLNAIKTANLHLQIASALPVLLRIASDICTLQTGCTNPSAATT